MKRPVGSARHAACRLLAFLLSGCTNAVSGGQPSAPQADFSFLPPVSNLSHTAASTGPLINGATAVKAAGATVEGESLWLQPPAPGFAHAVWAINLGELDLTAFQVKLETEGSAEVWLGVADYAAGRWQFSGPYLSGAPAVVCGAGDFTSPQGIAHVAAVALGGSARIEQLAFGVFKDFPAASGDLMWDAGRMQRLATDQRPGYAGIVQDVRFGGEFYRGWAVPDDGQWWPPLQNGLMALAGAWRLTGDAGYKDKLLAYLHCASRLSDLRDGREGAEDLDLGVTLTNLSVSYDWVRDSLDAETRSRIEALLFREAQYAYELFQPRRTRYFWNHAHFLAAGLYASGCVLDGYSPDATLWREAAADFFDQMELLQENKADAGYPEGCAYASAVYYLTAQYRELRRGFGGNLPVRDWWGRIPQYFSATLRPDLRETIRLADDDGKYIYPPDAVLRYVAACTGSQPAQHLANLLREKAGGQKESFALFAWQSALFTDPAVGEAAVLGPLTAHLSDLGLAVVRSSWEPDAWLLALRSGLPGGAAYNAYLASHPEDGYGGLGHMQCDLNSLSWWSGDACLLSDHGFEDLKLTQQHNTVTVSGSGQLGEGGAWWGWGWDWKDWGYGGRLMRATASGSDGFLAEMRCDDAYVPNAKLSKYRRRVLWCKPNLLLVQDRLGLLEPNPIEVNWHTAIGAWTKYANGAVSGSRLHCRALGLQPTAWETATVGIDSSTSGNRLQLVFAGVPGDTDLAYVLWDSEAVDGWSLQTASGASLAFSDGSRELILRVEGNQLAVRGYRSLDLPWQTI